MMKQAAKEVAAILYNYDGRVSLNDFFDALDYRQKFMAFSKAQTIIKAHERETQDVEQHS